MHIQGNQTLAKAGSVNEPTQGTPLVPKKPVLSLEEIIKQRKRYGEAAHIASLSFAMFGVVSLMQGLIANQCPSSPPDPEGSNCKPEKVKGDMIVCGSLGGMATASLATAAYLAKRWWTLRCQEEELKTAQRDTESA